MKLKTYQAWTMAEALAFVKTDLGGDAVILHTRTFDRGGFFGIGKRSVVEITAARAQDMPRAEPRASSSAAAASPNRRGPDPIRTSAAARAYGAALPAPAQTAAPALDMDAEREKTRRLAQVMAISLDRQGTARASASRNEEVVRDVVAARESTAQTEPASTRSEGPAQRFVLVPEVGSAGVSRLTAAVVRPAIERLPADRAAVATSISPTHSSAEQIRAVVETKPDGIPPELDAISEFVGRVLKRNGAEPALPVPAERAEPTVVAVTPHAAPRLAPAIEAARAALLEQEITPELAARLVAEIAPRFATVSDPSSEAVRAALLERLSACLPADLGDSFDVELGKHGPRRIAFVGPTGVGKTTTLAKIAAHLKLKRGLRVGIVAADTYRIAAVDQLRTYAEILGLPVEIASSPKDAARACASLSDVDVILIDTAGRSQNDHMKVSELRAFLASADADETHLVLSATASARTLAREADAFCPLGVDRIVLTKLDEAGAFGALVSVVERLGKRVSFFTHGQEVPDHIEIARSRRLAALVLGSEVR